ncbi:MAG: DNA-binding response regulator [Burkholderiales bacterium]|nr:MAG: DNA-binding response regulator [Burkholderiales bacterium]
MSTEGARGVVHLVDDDEAIRVALTRLFTAAGYTTHAYGSAGAFLIATGTEPDGCLVLDLHMPGPDGLALHDALRQRGWTVPTVFLTGRGDIPSSVRALKAGASDFLTKPVRSEVLLEAVRAALEADAPRRAARERRREARTRFGSLDARERTVLRRVVEGALTKQIAWELGVSERTVKADRASVMRKMGATTLPELVRLSEGLSPDGEPSSG